MRPLAATPLRLMYCSTSEQIHMTIQTSGHLVPSIELFTARYRYISLLIAATSLGRLLRLLHGRVGVTVLRCAVTWIKSDTSQDSNHFISQNWTLTLRSRRVARLRRRISTAVCYRWVDVGGHAVSLALRSTVSLALRSAISTSTSTAIAITSTAKSAATTRAVVGCFIDANRSTVKPTACKQQSQGLIRRRT